MPLRRPDRRRRPLTCSGNSATLKKAQKKADEEHHLGGDEQRHAVAQAEPHDRRVEALARGFADHVAPPEEHDAEHARAKPSDHAAPSDSRDMHSDTRQRSGARRRARRRSARGSDRPGDRAAWAWDRPWHGRDAHARAPSAHRMHLGAQFDGVQSSGRCAPHAARWRLRRCRLGAEEGVGQRDRVDVVGVADPWRSRDRRRSCTGKLAALARLQASAR